VIGVEHERPNLSAARLSRRLMRRSDDDRDLGGNDVSIGVNRDQ
jgi:hypothetical protein